MSMPKKQGLRRFVTVAAFAMLTGGASAAEIETRTVRLTPEEERCHRYVKNSPDAKNKPYSQIYDECAKSYKGIVQTSASKKAGVVVPVVGEP